MDRHLQEFGAEGAVRVRWFLDSPRSVGGWPGKRYEADWPPIRDGLLKLNALANQDRGLYDALRLQVVALLVRITNEIDQEIGLAQPEINTPASGLEERFRTDPAAEWLWRLV